MNEETTLELPLILRPRRLRVTWMLLMSLALCAATIAALGSDSLMAYAGTALFGLCSMALLAQLVTGLPQLRLDRHGFAVRGLFRSKSMAWSQVAGFSTMRTGLSTRVTWLPIRTDQEAASAGVFKTMNTIKLLPDNFGLKASLLAELMNTLRLEAAITAAQQEDTSAA